MCSSVRLVPCQPSPAYDAKKVPEYVLPPLLGDDIHLRSARRRLPQTAAERERHFLGDADFRDVAGNAHPDPSDTQAIHLDLSFVAPPARSLEHAEAGEVRARVSRHEPRRSVSSVFSVKAGLYLTKAHLG